MWSGEGISIAWALAERVGAILVSMYGQTLSEAVCRARALLGRIETECFSDAELLDAVAELAWLIQLAADEEQEDAESSTRALLARLMDDQSGQVFSNLMADRLFRSKSSERVVSVAGHLLGELGVPRYLSPVERFELLVAQAAAQTIPRVVARAMLSKLRARTRTVILSAREPGLTELLSQRRHERIRLNLNWLGEAVLGEGEAERRLGEYENLLRRPDVQAVSVKVSTLTSQLHLLAWEPTLARLRPRLRRLYRIALEEEYRTDDGEALAKLVNLDMEAYRDLYVTTELFQSTLDEPEFHRLTAGIALQAYLPDSFALQRRLTAWAIQRVHQGGAPIRLRIVKGANLGAETVESSTRGWALPIYSSKHEVDANYKRMIEFGCRPEHLGAVNLGVATHNTFDMAYALALGAKRSVASLLSFELLEGMAEPLRRVMQRLSGDVLLYAPVVDDGNLESAIAYLIRRLEENTGEDNFLRHSFAMQPGDRAWAAQEQLFRNAAEASADVSEVPRRCQLRGGVECARSSAGFVNEPDTDFSISGNRRWIRVELAKLRRRPCFRVPMQIAGRLVYRGEVVAGFDPSRPGVVPYRYPLASEAELAVALRVASATEEAWGQRPVDERNSVLHAVAAELRKRRGRLIAAMVLDAGKRVEEADAEVSEAIDFAEYYAETAALLGGDPSVECSPKGLTVVTPPWNFPLAIPAGGVFAALVMGNPVILKPARETPWVAFELAKVCWRAGIPKRALQLVFAEEKAASCLITDRRVHVVVLTGGTSTAQLFQELRPDLELLAETGGKNAMIVSDLADRDLAIASAVQSAFAHSGQKCSATSVLVCVKEVYDSPEFKVALRDAAASLPVGSAWDEDSFVTPLIRPPGGVLADVLESLEPGESWLLEPRCHSDNPRLWSPGIKLGVRRGSVMQTSELFGPLLAVVRVENIEEAINVVNDTPYGLTSGIHSLDEREQLLWLSQVEAGNLYINRTTTGAIVGRQPFGGYKASSFGPGAKAGGPNYIAGFVWIRDSKFRELGVALWPPVLALLAYAEPFLSESNRQAASESLRSYTGSLEHHFGLNHELGTVTGQLNSFRYRAIDRVMLRASDDASGLDVVRACAARLICSDRVELSISPGAFLRMPWLQSLPTCELRIETEEDAAKRVESRSVCVGGGPESAAIERVRCIGTPEPLLVCRVQQHGAYCVRQQVLSGGRWELRHYLREQSICIDYHRYGSLSAKALLPLSGASGVQHEILVRELPKAV